MWLICLFKLELVDKVDNRGIILQPCNMDIKLAYLQEYHTLIKLFTCAASLVASPPLLLGSMVPRGAQLAPPPSGAGTTEQQGRCKPHGISVRTLSFAYPPFPSHVVRTQCCNVGSGGCQWVWVPSFWGHRHYQFYI